MSTALGSSTAVSTWGKFRCAMSINDSTGTMGFSSYEYNIDYLAVLGGQKASADGSGLIRHPRFTYTVNVFQQPNIYSIFNPYFENRGNQLLGLPGAVTTEVENELLGQTVTLTGLTATLDATFFTTGTQFIGGTIAAQPIISIGKLTAF